MLMKKLNPADASRYLKDEHGIDRAPRTLGNYRSRGEGPAFHKISPIEVVYDTEDLDAWAAKLLGGRVHSTAEYGKQFELPLEDAK